MIFLLSPSKTMNVKDLQEADISLKPKTLAIQALLKKLTLEQVAESYKIKGKLLMETYETIQHFEAKGAKTAITLYEGSVFKALTLSTYTEAERDYLNRSVKILSAFYGVLSPDSLIKPYRLDMKHPLFKTLAADYWQEEVELALAQEPSIVNLASDEFSQMVKRPMIHCQFAEGLGQKLQVKSTYAKVARGQMMHYAIKNGCSDPEDLKDFDYGGYRYQPDLDHYGTKGDLTMVFARP